MVWATKHLKGLGTALTIQLEADQPQTILGELTQALSDFEALFSLHLPQSQLNQLNATAGQSGLVVPPDLFALIAHGRAASQLPHSQLNIALGPLVKAWQIGFADASIPEASHIEALLPLCDPQAILLDPTTYHVSLSKAGMMLDLGAVAKGYIADQVMSKALTLGARAALLDFGGNILVAGDSPKGQAWTVGIQTPFAPRGQVLGQVKLEGQQALVTSGVYERFLRGETGHHHHLLDPRTGYPMDTAMTSLSILAPSALVADTWATALFGLPISQALSKIEQEDGIEGIILTQEKTIHLSSGLKNRFVPHYGLF